MSTKVATHEGQEITLEADGRFKTSYGSDDILTDKTLAGLKRKIDNRARSAARAKAADLDVVVIEREERYVNGGRVREYKTVEGVYAGVNAHTGQVSLRRKDGKVIDVQGTFLRADNPELPRIRKLATQADTAERTARKLADQLREELDAHGRRLSIPYSGRGSKTGDAAEAEERLISWLSQVPGTAQ